MAAGLGYKDFVTGEVLTAGDVNGYLMQGVLVFASAAARNAAITSPQEGQFAYTKDVNGLWYYDGAAWVASGATGDIEGVTAGTGISGGGTSGTVTISIDSTVTTLTGSQTLTNKTLTAPIITYSANNQTGTTYTIVLADAGALVTMSNAAANAFKIPTNASVAYAIGSRIDILNIGAGLCTISAVTPGTTIVLSAGATAASPTVAQYKAATCIKTGTDAWYVIGGIA